ncbi:type VI secretion system tube protein TssD [Oceanospirillum maris]|jgi:type VI secretion system secreted protein Hcp|uniref:type VI secretion system tube protein TssD n=1 Tax=Oceanospirillum maris TaxID=64977 RepID=UPI000412671E|nr:type VI secretion system tube protein TssD [Oceanospirillum maris]
MARPGFISFTSAAQGALAGPEKQLSRDGLSHILSLQHGVDMPGAEDSRVLGGQPMHRPMEVVKPLDRVSPQLYQALCERDVLTKVMLFWCQFNSSGILELVYEIELKNARVVSLQPLMPNLLSVGQEDHPYCEQVSLIYESINWRYGPAAEVEFEARNEAGKA